MIECRIDAERAGRGILWLKWKVTLLLVAFQGFLVATGRLEGATLAVTGVSLVLYAAWSWHHRDRLLREEAERVAARDQRRAWHDPLTGRTSFEGFAVASLWAPRTVGRIEFGPDQFGGASFTTFGARACRVKTPAGVVEVPADFENVTEFAEALARLGESRPESASFGRRVRRGGRLQRLLVVAMVVTFALMAWLG